MKISKMIFNRVGLFPIRDHYYEPLFNPKHLKYSLDTDRVLPGIDLNVDRQISLLEKFEFYEELKTFPVEKTKDLEYYYHNNSYESGDSEYLYSIIRYVKPKKIIEIGSGFSTLMVINALKKNNKEDQSYQCLHICIEPYEMPWLENTNVQVKRELVENVPVTFFNDLGENDILFIDSSHMIRPQGDVLTEFLSILPALNKGVIVHVHDIFTPKDYPKEWVIDDVKLWNEQYLLEAFLSNNQHFEIIGALNFLKNHYFTKLSNKFPILKNEPDRQPGALWIRKIR